MPTEVILPRVDMDMTTGRIAKWYVAEGQAIEKGAPIFEIETDKAAMEIEAPASGIVRDLVGSAGEDVPVGTRVAWIYGTAEAHAAGNLVDGDPGNEAAVAVGPLTPADETRAAERPRATPLARRLARTHGLDLGAIAGSGPRGRIQSEDVLALATPDRQDPAGPALPRPDTAPQARLQAPLNHVWLRQGEGRPLLLLHGFGSEINGWRPFLSGLGLGRPILGLDLPGHGASALGGAAKFETLVSSVETSLRRLGLQGIDILGHSLGGAVATAVAAGGAVDCRSLTLLASAGLGPAIDGDFLQGFLRATTEASLTPWMHQLVKDPGDLPASFAKLVLQARAEGSLGPAQARLAAALFPDGTQAFSTRSLFERLTMPVKLIFGIEDRIIPARHSQGLPGTIAVHLFAGTGHLPHFERRSEVARLCGELLRAAS